MALLEQVSHRYVATVHVVYADRAPLCAVRGRPVDEHQRHAERRKSTQPNALVVDRSDEYAAYSLFEQQAEVLVLAHRVTVAVAHDQRQAASRPASSAPRATSLKNGFPASRKTYAMIRLLPARSWRADSLRTKPRSAMADSTRALVSGRTRSGRLSTFETVPTETPARSATSLIPAGPSNDHAPMIETPQILSLGTADSE